MSILRNLNKVLENTVFFRVSEHNALILDFYVKYFVTIKNMILCLFYGSTMCCFLCFFYTFSHFKRPFYRAKNKQKCKNLVSIRLETDMNFKNLLPYKMRLVVFLYLIQNLLYSTYFAQHSYLCYELFRIYA